MKIVLAKSFPIRLKGLMGEENIDYGMLFPKCNAIHTFFMKENIDIVGLNEENQVIYIYRNLPKNQIVRIKSDIKKTSILELPKDTSKFITMGSVLLFEDEDII
jgi:hypothetical protein